MLEDKIKARVHRRFVLPVEHRLRCDGHTPDESGGHICPGFMQATGMSVLQYGTHYEHKCDTCGAREMVNGEEFPKIIHRPVMEEET